MEQVTQQVLNPCGNTDWNIILIPEECKYTYHPFIMVRKAQTEMFT